MHFKQHKMYINSIPLFGINCDFNYEEHGNPNRVILQGDSKRLVFLLTGTGRKLSSFILNLIEF